MDGIDAEYVLKHGDPRISVLPLMDTPKKTITIILCYLIFIKVIGPRWMKHKKPFKLRELMVVYNAGLSLLSVWMFIRTASLYLFKYSWRCEPIDYSNSEDGVKAAMTCYVYFLSKIVELLDTIFFVLRKKYSQITFLHLFHHAVVPVTTWYGASYGAGGYALIFPLTNSFVHIWMYLYYGLAAVGPKMQRYLWWKKYITTLQLIQFGIVMASCGLLLLYPTENCNATNFILTLMMGQAIFFFGLFIHFYRNSYGKTTSKNPVKDRETYQNGHTIRREN